MRGSISLLANCRVTGNGNNAGAPVCSTPRNTEERSRNCKRCASECTFYPKCESSIQLTLHAMPQSDSSGLRSRFEKGQMVFSEPKDGAQKRDVRREDRGSAMWNDFEDCIQYWRGISLQDEASTRTVSQGDQRCRLLSMLPSTRNHATAVLEECCGAEYTHSCTFSRSCCLDLKG